MSCDACSYISRIKLIIFDCCRLWQAVNVKRAILSLSFFVTALSILFALYWLGFIQLKHPSAARYPIRGIDVSHHQGSIDWPQLISESRVSFVYLKASEGATLRDPLFIRNWEASKSIARGAYHFFSFCTDGQAQAMNSLTVAPLGSELPPAVDIEFGGNCRSWESIERIRGELSEFLEAVTTSYARTQSST